MDKKKICIIGAGPSGLSSARESVRFGLLPTVLEKQSSVGGLWVNNTGFTWDSMSTNITKFSCGFSDYPMSDEEDIYPNQERVSKFCDQFCKDFKLYQYIKFNSKVVKVDRINNNKQWKVEWVNITDQDIINEDKLGYSSNSNGDTGNSFSEIFDYLIVASGVFSKSNHTELESVLDSKFNGTVLNSRFYKNPDIYKDKKVVVVGTSYSGCEIAAEVSKVSNKCIQIGHKNYWVLNKYLPLPITVPSTESSTPKTIIKTVPLDILFFCRSRAYDGLKLSIEEKFNKRNAFYKTICQEQDLDKNPNSTIAVKHNDGEPTFAIISSVYKDQVTNGSIQVYSNDNFNITNIIDGNTLEFTNEKGQVFIESNVDHIILCTGYRSNLSFLQHDQELLQDIYFDENNSLLPLILHKNVLPVTNKYNNLAFVGVYRGPFFSEIELASRLAILTFTNNLEYPSDEKLKESLLQSQQLRNLSPNKTPQFPVLDFIVYCEQLAQEVGCLPDYEKLKTQDPELYNIVWNGFFNSSAYRLYGIGSNFEKSRAHIIKVNEIANKFKSI